MSPISHAARRRCRTAFTGIAVTNSSIIVLRKTGRRQGSLKRKSYAQAPDVMKRKTIYCAFTIASFVAPASNRNYLFSTQQSKLLCDVRREIIQLASGKRQVEKSDKGRISYMPMRARRPLCLHACTNIRNLNNGAHNTLVNQKISQAVSHETHIAMNLRGPATLFFSAHALLHQ
jgi:hypothetical protein